MLEKIRLKNFKLHEDTSIEAAPITVFIGPNNSGKSSIFQALLALKQACRRGLDVLCQPALREATSQGQPFLFPRGELQDLGEFKHVSRRVAGVVQIGAEGSVTLRTSTHPKIPVELKFETRIENNNLTTHFGELTCAYGRAAWDWIKDETPPRTGQLSFRVEDVQVNIAPISRFQLIELSGYSAPPNYPRQKMAEILEVANALGAAVRSILDTLRPIFPVRGFEEWAYALPDAPPDHLDMLSLADRALAMAGILAYNRVLEDKISQRLGELLQVGIEVRLAPPRRVTVFAKQSPRMGPETLFSSEGTGANQLPFILVPVALAEPGATILLSEPEAHLHPKAQSELTAMLLEVSRKADLQFFIETHSEHVLHKLLHAVAKGELERDDLTIYYFPEPKDGKADPQKLTIDEKGGVEGGLPGFFDQSLSELTDYLEALKPK